MALTKLVADMTQYILLAAARIFGPDDDNYPAIGLQPFEGEPCEQWLSLDW